MTEADRISANANVDHGLAELVVIAANRADVTTRRLRSSARTFDLIAARLWVIEAARPRHSLPAIGRALNRDHTTILHHERALRAKSPRITNGPL